MRTYLMEDLLLAFVKFPTVSNSRVPTATLGHICSHGEVPGEVAKGQQVGGVSFMTQSCECRSAVVRQYRCAALPFTTSKCI